MNDVQLAEHIARKYHAGQMYGDYPYEYHLSAVYQSVKATGTQDERLLAVAWLHDILEDTECTVTILAALFDKDVVKAVEAITYKKGDSRQQYLAEVRANNLARGVKLHDAFCNLRESLQRMDTRRIKKYGETLAALA